jgi:hypothetical protein
VFAPITDFFWAIRGRAPLLPWEEIASDNKKTRNKQTKMSSLGCVKELWVRAFRTAVVLQQQAAVVAV